MTDGVTLFNETFVYSAGGLCDRSLLGVTFGKDLAISLLIALDDRPKTEALFNSLARQRS